MKCRWCGKGIVGGKGDYWHENYSGSMRCEDGEHLAEPEPVDLVMNPDPVWPSKWRFYLRVGQHREDFIGPFATMTKAYRYRRDFGPKEAEITSMPDHFFTGLLPATSPERHRAEWEGS